jgi:hypothetical protein
MSKKLNYMYINMFLSVSRLLISVSWDVGQIILMQLEFPQLKFIPNCFYCIKYISDVLILMLQVMTKLDFKPHWRGWFGFCSSHTCSIICVLYSIKDVLFQEDLQFSFMCSVFCVLIMCKVFLKIPMLKKYFNTLGTGDADLRFCVMLKTDDAKLPFNTRLFFMHLITQYMERT